VVFIIIHLNNGEKGNEIRDERMRSATERGEKTFDLRTMKVNGIESNVVTKARSVINGDYLFFKLRTKEGKMIQSTLEIVFKLFDDFSVMFDVF